MSQRTKSRTKPIFLALAVLSGLAWAAATQVTVLVVNLGDAKRTLVVKRPEGEGVRFLDSPEAICARKLGKPIRLMVSMEEGMCRFAVVASAVEDERNVYLRLPFSDFLRDRTLKGMHIWE